MSDKFRDSWPEMHIKHLEFIQNVIARTSGQSANLKNYCMSVIAGLVGLTAAVNKPYILLFTVLIVIVFACLDANYLRIEKAFRSQYDQVRKEPLEKQPDFLITTGFVSAHSLLTACWSWSIWWFYAPLVFILLAIYFWGW